MGKIVGIDLGTTNSVVAIHEGKETKVIVNAEGNRLTPSVVAFSDEGRLVGRIARNQAVRNPKNTVYSIKRFMGRRHREVDAEEKLVPYRIVGGQDELVQVEVEGKRYYPPEISAMILQDLKKSAETYLGEKVTEAVITVPAYFNDSQRQATKEAGKIAGFEVKRIFNEPTAAALAYGLDKKKDEQIAVFDLGGGTYDISILEVSEGLIEVRATNGDTHLGGDDWDRCLVDWVADEFKKETSIDLRKDPMALQRLVEACEKAKCDLSTLTETTINLPYITLDAGGPRHLTMKVTRAKFEALTEHLFERLKRPVLQALEDAHMKPSDIDEVVLVGGSTRMSRAQQVAKELFEGKEPNRTVNPDEVVAVGAAIQAAVLGGDMREILLLDVTPLSLGVETMGGVMTTLVPRNTRIPHSKSEVFSTAGDNQPAVDIHVMQGERPMARDNRTLGKFQLSGIPLAPRGIPQIEVTFNINSDGILEVAAKDKGTGREQKIEIKSSSGLGKEEVERMVREAKDHEAEDKKKGEDAEARNKADHLCYETEKLLREQEAKVPAAHRDRLEEAVRNVRAAIKEDDRERLDRAVRKLEEASGKLAEELYRSASSESKAKGQAAPREEREPGPAPESGQPRRPKDTDGEVIDVEGRRVDDNK